MKLPLYTPVWNWRNATNQTKQYPIHIRIHLAGDDKYHPIDVPRKVRKEEWVGKPNSWVKNTHPFAFEINSRIKETTDILDELVKRYFNAKKSLTFPLIFKELHKNNNSNLFNAYFDEVNKDPRETLDDETMRRYKACLGHLNRFNPAIAFHDLSDELFQQFKKYLEKEGKLVGSTVNGYFNAIKKVAHWARKDHHISKQHEESLFEDIHIKIGKPKKDHLEIEEIQQWKNFIFPAKNKSLARDRDLFLLLIYTGFYYSDLKESLKADLRKDPEYGYYFYSDRYKNENLAIVPLWKFPHAMELIDRYKNEVPQSPYLIDRKYLTDDHPFNRNLKAIAKLLGWTKNMYNKLGRNTNSQLYIRFGANRPIVSKILGHGKEETTSAYFEVNIRDIIEGVKDIDFGKAGI
jgi:site-specific recombinase XerD